MLSRSLDNVLREFVDEAHLPMQRLVRSLMGDEWAGVGWDVSMLRLWAGKAGESVPRIVVTFADGRMGGRPVDQALDLFEIRTLSAGHLEAAVVTRGLDETIAAMRRALADTITASA